ncbi:MAG TPA: exodeoxyribonuclease V subunit alpha [Polyangiaceae bacterium]|nr:exodeoxyribonuclease V subunit alpha [Polyangiaceae bacterium]
MSATLLEQLWSYGVLSALDYHFARSLAALGGANEETLFCAALASRAVQLGHVCLDVTRVEDLRFVDRAAQAELGEARAELVCPPAERLLAALRASPLCGSGEAPTPLVLDARGRLYLQRYAQHERELATTLLARARPASDIDLERLGERLRRRFPRAPDARAAALDPDPLELAAAVAALQRLAIICGGPGTGKTTTVVKLLALLQEQALEQTGAPLGITMLAPTGKAAQRLATSVSNGLGALELSEPVRAAIPAQASTIHRALGGGRGSARFWHDAENPLPADLLVVDEVSMVDLVLLRQLVSALRPEARLILLGDKDQLASVEAGAILGDIYDAGAAARWSEDFARRLQLATGLTVRATAEAPALGDCLVNLEQSHRYAADSGIGQLARAINRGDAEASLLLLEPGASSPGDCRRYEPEAHASSGESALEQLALAGYRPFIECRDPAQKLALLESYRVLCAYRQGARGVERLNAEIEGWLARARLIDPEARFYENRPVLVTRNDYGLGLFNGDVGVVVREGPRLRVCFQGAEGLRFLAPSRLPPHETVFAMTIHKSQGSEFNAVSVVLPETVSPLLSRELLYTAVTRARQRVDVLGTREVVRAAVSRAIQRASGLHDALWSADA